MKRIYSLLIICLLLAVSCGHRESLRQRAYHSLDTVTRLYEAGNDSIDAELLAPALAYFPEKGDASTKAKLWYQWGYISLTHGYYDKAIVSFEKGLEQARIIGDYHLEGLICRAMADTYNRTFNIREDTVYLEELAAVTGLTMVGNLPVADMAHTAFTHEGLCLVNGVKVPEGKVRSLSLIGRLVFLEKLALVCQPLSDPSPLSGLLMLKELYLSGDGAITSLDGLTDLPRLERLHLEHSGVRDLSPLAALPSLETVFVSADMLPLTWPEAPGFTVVLVP